LSPVDPLDAHEAATCAYLEGSCTWFFESEEFVLWKQSSGSRLWLSGFRKHCIDLILTRTNFMRP